MKKKKLSNFNLKFKYKKFWRNVNIPYFNFKMKCEKLFFLDSLLRLNH